MAANPYASAPLCAAAADPATGRHLRAYFFLGAAPRAVLEAARRGRPRAGGDPRRPEWAAADGATLRAHYGPGWRELLTGADPPAPEALAAPAARVAASLAFRAPLYAGGGEGPGAAGSALDFGGLGDLDDFSDFSGEGRAEGGPADGFLGPAPGAGPGPDRGAAAPPTGAGPPVYTDLAVYPEDTVLDLRLKLSLAAGVPLYRQHFFFYVAGEGPVYPYRITVDGAPVVVDWRALAPAAGPGGGPGGAAAAAAVAGVAVEPRLAERREGLAVAALDALTVLGPAPGVRVTQAFFVDLAAVVPPLGAPERREDGLAAALRDRFQFDLLWWGGLLKYWPHLGPDACALALGAPGRVAAAYPALDPEPAALAARFAAERAVADAAHRWRPAAAPGGRAPVAVTAATVRVAPAAAAMRVAVRNVFDWVPTGPAVAAAAARFEVDAAAAGPAAPGRGGGLPVAAAKRHASSYGPRVAPAVDAFLARAPARDSVAWALPRAAPADDQRAGLAGARAVPFAWLAVHADGRYEAAADWREDDRAGFGAVAAELAAVVAPTVAAVNAMGAAAFPVGGALAPLRPGPGAGPGAGPGVALGAITASAFWPHALTAADFRDLKERFRAYERAGVVAVRGLQQVGAYTVAFRKGVVAYGDRAPPPAGANQYAWLTDAAAAARWAAAHPGRTVRIHHRATDLRVEILHADSLAEFELIRRYVFAFLDGLPAARAPARRGPPRAPPARAEEGAPAGRRLRRLQERDPNLFDLKKYDPGATVYSVLCQSGRQPHVYNEAEARHLAPRRRAALVRYWNFTEDEAALYECPDPKFPHLSFRAGRHPLGYCLPCCKKTRPAAGSRAALVNEGCLGRRPAAAPAAAQSRHVLTYGKAVPPGRLGEPPRAVGEGLFLAALPEPHRLLLVGVEQAAPAVPAAGHAYALAHALGLGAATADLVLGELAAAAAAAGEAFRELGGGAAAAFADAGALADAILAAFVRRSPGLSPFGPGGAVAGAWPAILADLGRLAFGVETVVLEDPDGTGDVTLSASAEAAATIAGPAALGAGAPRLRVAVLVAGPMGTYPLSALNPRLYLRAAAGQRWMAERRTFAVADPGADAEAGADYVPDRVGAAVRDALAGQTAPPWPSNLAGPGAAGRLPDLAFVAGCAAAPGAPFAVARRLANLRGMCYAVLLRGAGGAGAYVPVRYSACPADGTPTEHGPRPAAALPRGALDAALAWLNAAAAAAAPGAAAAGEMPVAPIRAAAPILDAAGLAIGFVHEAADGALCFYHDPEPPAPGATAAAAAAVRFPYDSRLVDEAIAAAARGPKVPPPRDPRAAAASGRNRAYRLFLAEFAAALRADRDAALREKLAAAIRATRFEAPKSVEALRRRLFDLLRGHPGDLATVRAAVTRALVAAPQDPGAAAAAAIEATVFGFDHHTLARLRALPSHAETAAALRRLLAPRVAADPGPARDPDNMYAACADRGGPQCLGARLAVEASRLDDFYDILAADVRNAGKGPLLTAVSAGVFAPLDFIRRPGEHLSVTVGA